MNFANKETQFKKGKSGNPAGQPKGFISLDTMVRRILEGDELQPAVAETIKEAVVLFRSTGTEVKMISKLALETSDAFIRDSRHHLDELELR